MPRYRRKPTEITAVQFHFGETIPADIRAVDKVSLTQQFEVYNGLHNSWIKLKLGDYIRTDDPNDNYPIDEATFAETYEEIIEVNDHG